MGKKGRRFLDKRRDVLHTFKVVSRSQRDPLVADSSAPQGVLQPTQDNEASQKTEQEKYGIFFDDDYDYLQHLRGVREAVNWDEEDLEVYTIRREDPQAGKKELRNKKLVLPSSAFESFVEEPIGLLNKAAPLTGPRPELDPDVVAGLDDDDIFNDNVACGPEDDDALPDNFVMMLNSEVPVHQLEDDGEWEDYEEDEEDDDDDDEEEDGEMVGLRDMGVNGLHLPSLAKLSAYREKGQDEGYDADEEEKDFSSDFNDSGDEDERRDELGSLDAPTFPRPFLEEEETKSHFTNYSLTSSVLPRKDHLNTLDDCFEEKFIREYGEDQVGALDGEDIDGFVGEESPLFRQALQHSRRQLQEDSQDDHDRIIKWIKDMQERRGNAEEEEEKEEVEVSDEESKERWDCETILTMNSTLYNHPRTITDPPRRKKIAVDPRTGIPLEHRVSGLTRRNLAHHDKAADTADNEILPDSQTLITSMSAISIRPPGETSEERRFRKKALKELRRERRIEKKLNRVAFKGEKKRQEKILMNNKYNNKISLM